jgi:carbonic anhydrase
LKTYLFASILFLVFTTIDAAEQTYSRSHDATDRSHAPSHAADKPQTKSHAAGKAHWSYSGATGPEHWAKLSPKFADCAGRNQSPIDLNTFIDADLEPIKFTYSMGSEVINNGHTIKVSSDSGGRLEVDGKSFRLLQYHFHAPSENHINGESFAIEAHLVHADDKGNLAVVAVMFEEGEENPTLSHVWQVMPRRVGDKKSLSASVQPYKLLPSDRSYYRFNGSLTTPPCTEGVRWIVMKKPVKASARQISEFERVMGHPNNRPIQPLNSRTVLK